MPLYFSRFKPLRFTHLVFVITHKLMLVINHTGLYSPHIKNEKRLAILPNGFPVTEFKVSGSSEPVNYSKAFEKSNWHFNSPLTPSLRDLRVLLGIMHLAIKLGHQNELDEGCEMFTTLSEIKAASAIGSNLNDIKSSILSLSQISLMVGNDFHFLIECDQLNQPDRFSDVVLVLHPILVNSIQTFLNKHHSDKPTFFSIYYIDDLCMLSKGLGAKTAQSLYVYYSSTISQGNQAFSHSSDTLCRKIYHLEGKLNGGNRRSLTQGIWRLTEVGWQILSRPTKKLFIVSRPDRQGVARAKTNKLKLQSELASKTKLENNTYSANKGYRKRHPIMRA